MDHIAPESKRPRDSNLQQTMTSPSVDEDLYRLLPPPAPTTRIRYSGVRHKFTDADHEFFKVMASTCVELYR